MSIYIGAGADGPGVRDGAARQGRGRWVAVRGGRTFGRIRAHPTGECRQRGGEVPTDHDRKGDIARKKKAKKKTKKTRNYKDDEEKKIEKKSQ